MTKNTGQSVGHNATNGDCTVANKVKSKGSIGEQAAAMVKAKVGEAKPIAKGADAKTLIARAKAEGKQFASDAMESAVSAAQAVITTVRKISTGTNGRALYDVQCLIGHMSGADSANRWEALGFTLPPSKDGAEPTPVRSGSQYIQFLTGASDDIPAIREVIRRAAYNWAEDKDGGNGCKVVTGPTGGRAVTDRKATASIMVKSGDSKFPRTVFDRSKPEHVAQVLAAALGEEAAKVGAVLVVSDGKPSAFNPTVQAHVLALYGMLDMVGIKRLIAALQSQMAAHSAAERKVRGA